MDRNDDRVCWYELDPTTNRERDELRKEIGRNIEMVAPIRYAPAIQTDIALAVPTSIELGTEKVSLSAASKRGFGEGLRRDAPIWVIQSLRRQVRLADTLFVRCTPNGRQNDAYYAAEVTRSVVDCRPMRAAISRVNGASFLNRKDRIAGPSEIRPGVLNSATARADICLCFFCAIC